MTIPEYRSIPENWKMNTAVLSLESTLRYVNTREYSSTEERQNMHFGGPTINDDWEFYWSCFSIAFFSSNLLLVVISRTIGGDIRTPRGGSISTLYVQYYCTVRTQYGTLRTKNTNGGEEGWPLAARFSLSPWRKFYLRAICTPPLKIKICFNVVLLVVAAFGFRSRRRAAGTRDKQQQPGGLNRRDLILCHLRTIRYLN